MTTDSRLLPHAVAKSSRLTKYRKLLSELTQLEDELLREGVITHRRVHTRRGIHSGRIDTEEHEFYNKSDE